MNPENPPAAQLLSEELASILDLSPDACIAFGSDARVRYVSTVFESLTGLARAHLLGLDEDHFWALIAPLCLPGRGAGEVAEIRHNLSLVHNQRRNLLELAQPAARVLLVSQREGQGGSIWKVLGFRDLSQETELDRRKSEFLAAAAHELRTPLASIYGFAETLLTDELDAATRQEFIGIIYQQSQAMSQLLNEMLDLARIEARRQCDVVFAEVDASQWVRQVIDGFKPPAGRAAAVLEAAPTGLRLRVDVKKASQVLLNVLSNAYKYSPDGGEVRIALESVTAAGSPPELRIHVSDCGIGMTAAQQSRVFERFYRANPGSRIAGTGLGMSIVKELMSLLAGRVALSSSPGQGTCVSLIFPAASGSR
jgi:signal transduction histidine kinase